LKQVVSNPEKICFDPALARGTAYYTGPIFEVVVEGFSGSIGGGGRYDGLIGLFSGKKIPACGISLGFERLLLLMEERSLFPEEVSAGCDLFVAQFPGVDPVPSLVVAGRLRAEGYSVNVSPEAGRMKKQFKQAEERGARAVMLIGPEEEAAGSAVIKSMESGEQHVCPLEEVVGFVGSLLRKSDT
jgi:histidyl-tRNA synthetase